MVTLEPASLAEVRACWGWVEQKLLAVILACEADFVPADVYREISSGSVFLYWVNSWCVREGVIIFSQHQDKYSLRTILGVDMLSVRAGSVDLPELGSEIEKLAVDVGADRIEWFSPRPGWTGLLGKIGYKADSMIFTREVGRG
jgi:hypothetical protein